MLIGLLIDIILFQKIAIGYLLNIFAVLIFLIAAKVLFIQKLNLHISIIITVVIIVAAEIIHGILLLGGSLLVFYTLTSLKDKSEFTATITSVWVILNMGLILNHIRLGYVTEDILKLISYLVIPLILAIVIANILHKYIKQEVFLIIAYILLLISGLSLLIR